jgi:hypothetical protein
VSNTILQNLRVVCQVLNENGVEYVTVGGAAVALHGHARLSKDSSGRDAKVDDLDFRYNPTYDNYFRVLDALEKLGEDVSVFRKEQSPDPKRSFFRFQKATYTLDLIPEIPGLPKFREVFNAKGTADVEGVDVPFISFDYLIQNKQALGRPKDLDDIKQLRQKKQSQQPRQRRPRQRPG